MIKFIFFWIGAFLLGCFVGIKFDLWGYVETNKRYNRCRNCEHLKLITASGAIKCFCYFSDPPKICNKFSQKSQQKSNDGGKTVLNVLSDILDDKMN